MNSITKLRCFIAAAVLILVASSVFGGQSNATLSGPILGYVFSAPEGKLRPLRGVVGSTTIGDPMQFDFAISQAWTLDARHFVVTTDSSPELLAVGLVTNPGSVARISGLPSDPSQAAASVHGTAAAFYYRGTQRLLIVTGFPDNPAVSHSADLATNNGQPLTRVAVSDDGATVVYAVQEVDRESLYVWNSSTSISRFAFSVVSVGGIAIAGNGAAIITDRGANEVFAIVDPRNTAVSLFLLGVRDGVSRPADVAISSDNQIYVANTGADTLMTLDSSGRLLRTQYCNCGLSGLNRLQDSKFRLTDRLDQTVYLLDTNAGEDHIWFVPALRTTP